MLQVGRQETCSYTHYGKLRLIVKALALSIHDFHKIFLSKNSEMEMFRSSRMIARTSMATMLFKEELFHTPETCWVMKTRQKLVDFV